MPDKALLDLIKNKNIANDLDTKKLLEIRKDVMDGYNNDLNSRTEWQHTADKILKLAKMTIERKSFPWDGAANVKYPVIATAILQYAARTYPEIVRDGKVVQAAVVGSDPDGEKAARARRISEFMSYQLLLESDTWEANMDKLLHVYPAVGVAFKKTYYDPIKQCNESILCLHDEIVINDEVPSLEEAQRVTHLIRQSHNTIVSNLRAGLYTEPQLPSQKDMIEKSLDQGDDFHELLEQHCYIDLDDDGYKEPYIVTIHKKTEHILRIVARFDPTGILYNEKEQVVSITPVQYFTDFHCIPRMDGRYHSLGLGTLLLHPNEVINTTINSLLDSATLANLQCGFIGNNVEVQGGMKPFALGEWKKARVLDGSALKDQVLPITYKEPSSVSFKLLETMIKSAQELSSVTDILTGNQPAQNVAATTTQILQENSVKIFSSLQRRLYRGLKSEFEKLYRLNRIYLPPISYYKVMDDQKTIDKHDFNDRDLDIKPVSDPNLSSEAQRVSKANVILQMAMQIPGMNVQEALMRALMAMDIPHPEKLVGTAGQQQQPDPAMLKVQADMQQHQDIMGLKQKELQLKATEMQMKAGKIDAETDKIKAQATQHLTQAAAIEVKHEQDQQQQVHNNMMDVADHSLASDQLQANIEKDRMKAHTDSIKARAAIIQAKKPVNNGKSND